LAWLEWIGLAVAACAVPFFIGAAAGLLRFPDLYTRLHALTKADNAGLGLVVFGLMLQADSWAAALKLLLVWVLVLGASSTAGFLVASTARRRGLPPWTGGRP
jgi:multicomponent Na+:H+ antiporter subunit G